MGPLTRPFQYPGQLPGSGETAARRICFVFPWSDLHSSPVIKKKKLYCCFMMIIHSAHSKMLLKNYK